MATSSLDSCLVRYSKNGSFQSFNSDEVKPPLEGAQDKAALLHNVVVARALWSKNGKGDMVQHHTMSSLPYPINAELLEELVGYDRGITPEKWAEHITKVIKKSSELLNPTAVA